MAKASRRTGKQKTKSCFVVSPIGEAGSSVRVRADWLYEGIIVPIVGAVFSVSRADGITIPGAIDLQIIDRLQTADLVIADMTGLNPNVFYEIGIRHCTDKPIIHMVSKDEVIPFDVKMYRAITYSTATPADVREAQRQLKAHVAEVQRPGYQSSTPVRTAISLQTLRNSPEAANKELIEEFLRLKDRVNAIERDRANSSKGEQRTLKPISNWTDYIAKTIPEWREPADQEKATLIRRMILKRALEAVNTPASEEVQPDDKKTKEEN
ncbi:hypothetical protein [Dongia sedimenti]|uniref:Uncharacterized protein n=1 Tax=Dongia sedimenti TaxID=3064282 RepID=A0ABU0YEY1_9PROT|nr:hypothetical protein [Rhodospirillaceae bacterium R-7]